jgi:site-specific DNA recombinase
VAILEKAIAYIRVSTEEQVAKGQGLEIQGKEINEYSEKNKLDIVKIFCDEGVSGANEINKRKGLNDLLNYCKSNKVDKVLITKIDRLARDVYIFLWIEKELKVCGAKITSISEDNLNGNDYMTNAMRQMISVFAELEKNRITDRLLSGRINKVEAKGMKASGSCPIGYEYNENKQVVLVPEEVELVKSIFSMYLQGLSLRKIVDKVNDEGYRTKRGNLYSRQAIRRILKNDFYTGVLRFRKIVKKKANHPAIISNIIYGKVQKLLERNKR